jgi:hypothetical protein
VLCHFPAVGRQPSVLVGFDGELLGVMEKGLRAKLLPFSWTVRSKVLKQKNSG